MSEFTGHFNFVCDAYIYHREGDEMIEEHGKVFHKEAFLNKDRWVPGDTYFLMDNGEQRRCAAKHYLLVRGYMWMPYSSIRTAKNVFRIHGKLEDYRNTEKVPALSNEELDRVYSSLEEVYPNIAAYESRSALFRKGVEDGYISQAVCDHAKKLYGRLWNYVGD